MKDTNLSALEPPKLKYLSGSSHLAYSQKAQLQWEVTNLSGRTGEKRKQWGRENHRSINFGENQRHSNRQNPKLPAQKYFLRAVFWVWTWLSRPKAITHSLPFAKGSTHSWPKHRVTPGQLSSFPDRSCPSWVRGVHPERQKTIPKRKKPESPWLDLLCSIPSYCSYRRFVYGEGELRGATPTDVCEGDPPRGITAVREHKTPDHCTQRTPLGSPQCWFSNSWSFSISRGSHTSALTSHQKAGHKHPKLEKWGEWVIPRYFCTSWGKKSPLP